MFIFEDGSETSYVSSAKSFDAVGHSRDLENASSNDADTSLAGSDDTSEPNISRGGPARTVFGSALNTSPMISFWK